MGSNTQTHQGEKVSLRNFRFIWAVGMIVTGLIMVTPIVLFAFNDGHDAGDPWEFVAEGSEAIDHSALLQGPFETGSDVTRACLGCHEDAASDVMQTSHWLWRGEPVLLEGRDEPVSIGKANLLNNFCIGIQSNWQGCSRCHAGYGWEDASFDFTVESNVDCLVCHDQSGQYAKSTAGYPAEEVDLVLAAQSVGTPTRENCGGCHFNGGGGNAVKHGDLDESLYYPSENIDVHMGRLDFQCIDCHQTEDHHISGRAISVSVDPENQVYCTDCHQPDLHEDTRINEHTDAVACQTCHIPVGAVREPTKMEWDWSTAGQADIEEDPHSYLMIKGSFVYEEQFTPDYAWHNGWVDRYLLGDTINPDDVTVLNPPQGGIDDPNSLIMPFKIHRAQQIFDAINLWLIQPKTVGEGGYWTDFDWDQAATLGSDAVGFDYSGEYDFTGTEMYWTLSHMVAPSEQALQCTDCHGEGTRMDWEALGYFGDPMLWGGRD